MNSSKTASMIYVALTAALISLLAQLSVPLPNGVPLTAQVVAVAFGGYLLGVKKGSIAIGIYIALGMVGAPVFSGFSGGFQRILSPTGGFIWGFLPLSIACGIGEMKRWSKHEKIYAVACGTVGLILCHLCGIIQFSAVMQCDPITAALISSLPYLIKDIVCVIAAYLLACAVKRRIGHIR